MNMNDFQIQLNAKTKTADEAVKVVKNGDWIFYGEFVTITPALDKALAKRKNELRDIHLLGCTFRYDSECSKVDPNREVFDINDRSLTPFSRKQNAYLLPGSYEMFEKQMHMRRENVAFIAACPMDQNEYFNLSTTCSITHALLETCDHIILEINDKLPVCYGGEAIAFHISEIDAVVYGDNMPLESLPKLPSSEVDKKIAENVMKELEDGCCLQLGIGGIPNKIGEFIFDSDIKDLGVHTEMMMDSFMQLQNMDA